MKKKLKIKKSVLFIFLGILAILLAFLVWFVNTKVVFELIDEDSNTLLLNEEFKDPGVEAKHCVFSKCKYLDDKVTIDSNIDNNSSKKNSNTND